MRGASPGGGGVRRGDREFGCRGAAAAAHGSAIGLIDRLAGCFIDERNPDLIEHTVRTLIGQRVFGMALGYEDLNDHEQLRHDAVFGALLGASGPAIRLRGAGR